jgi:hypothetical protein
VSWVADWKAQMVPVLDQLRQGFEQWYGYPPGENAVRDAVPGAPVVAGLPPLLAEFYAEVGEVSLPDVHIGYFVHPAGWLAEAAERGLPVRMTGAVEGDLIPFGSTGGGDPFVVLRSDGSVLHLPPGRIDDGTYLAAAAPAVVAADLRGFLQRLLDVTREFVTTGETKGL